NQFRRPPALGAIASNAEKSVGTSGLVATQRDRILDESRGAVAIGERRLERSERLAGLQDSMEGTRGRVRAIGVADGVAGVRSDEIAGRAAGDAAVGAVDSRGHAVHIGLEVRVRQ